MKKGMITVVALLLVCAGVAAGITVPLICNSQSVRYGEEFSPDTGENARTGESERAEQPTEQYLPVKADEMGFFPVSETVWVTSSALNLRAEPKTGTVLGCAVQGEALLRIGINDELGWSRISWNGQIVYASSKHLFERNGREDSTSGTKEPDVPPSEPQVSVSVCLPPSIVLTVGEPFTFVNDEIVASMPDGCTARYTYLGTGKTEGDENGFTVTPEWQDHSAASPHAPENATLKFEIIHTASASRRVVYSGQVAVRVVEKRKTMQLTGILIGDSRISDGTIVSKLTSDLPGLTLLGTRKTGKIPAMHEGRGGWSSRDYLTSPSVSVGDWKVSNAFYSTAAGGFDFTYYMEENHPGSVPDFVLINLGANDGYGVDAVANIAEMVDSVQAFGRTNGKQIRVFVMTEYRSSSGPYSSTVTNNVPAIRQKQFAFNQALYQRLTNATILPNYLCIDGFRDRITKAEGGSSLITDAVHLGSAGYRKEALMIESYLFDCFGSAVKTDP